MPCREGNTQQKQQKVLAVGYGRRYAIPVHCSVINFIQLIVYTLYYMLSESVEMYTQL